MWTTVSTFSSVNSKSDLAERTRSTKNATAAAALKMHVEDLLELGIVDQMIPEPLGGAHLDPKTAYQNAKTFIKDRWETLKMVPIDLLIENRYQKFRKMGKFESQQT